MRHWTHDELHALMDNSPVLKEKSDKIHSLPDSDSIDSWQEGKRQMTAIYADAVNCDKLMDALAFIDDVFAHIKKFCRTKQEWHALPSSPESSGVIKQMSKVATDGQVCHSSNGNNYICFCDEKTA